MRIKSLLSTIFLCGVAAFAMAQEPAKVDTTEMGVHPYKDTHNMAWETTGFSLTLHGGVNVFNGDYPTNRFTNFGYPTVGLNVEYNFSPMWGIGLGYGFSMPQVTYNGGKEKAPGAFRDVDGTSPLTVNVGDPMYKSMMHKGQIYLTFDLINAWFPRAWKDIFGLNVFAGIGATLYKNSVSFHDTGELNADGKVSDSGKYVKDGDDAHAHGKYESVGFVPVGASAEFNVSRQIAIGARFQYNMFLNDYVDNRYMDKANKRNDGMYDAEILLRWKIAAKKKNHMMNLASLDVMEDKYYKSHPHRRRRNHAVDTVLFYHRDTIVVIHRDTVFMNAAPVQVVQQTEAPVVQQPVSDPCLDKELYPGWESEADEVVVEGQSFSQIARKYYKNTFCWVYLWLANRTTAPDPNLIMPKCVMKVPKLNACQLKITKQEAKDMCARYRGE